MPEATKIEKAKTRAVTKAEYRKGSLVVYPAHGPGKVLGTETREVSGHSLELIVIHFDADRMTLRVPVGKAKNNGLRGPSSRTVMDQAIETLKGRATWTRRAMEFNAKISSGNPVLVAEVVRDLHVNVDAENRSYSERQIYETALGRLVRELAAVEGTNEKMATLRVLKAADAPKAASKAVDAPKVVGLTKAAPKVVDAPQVVDTLAAEAA